MQQYCMRQNQTTWNASKPDLVKNTVHLPYTKAAIPIYHVKWRSSKANDHQQKPNQPTDKLLLSTVNLIWKLTDQPTNNKKQTKDYPEQLIFRRPQPYTSASIENVMIFLIEMKNSIEDNLKFSKGIAHQSTLSIKNYLVPFFPDKINHETQRDSSHLGF